MKRIFYVQSPGSEISLKKTPDYPAKTQTFENLFSFLNLLLSTSIYSLSEIIFCLKTHIPLHLFLNLPNVWGQAVTPIIPARRLHNEESKKSTHYSPTKTPHAQHLELVPYIYSSRCPLWDFSVLFFVIWFLPTELLLPSLQFQFGFFNILLSPSPLISSPLSPSPFAVTI